MRGESKITWTARNLMITDVSIRQKIDSKKLYAILTVIPPFAPPDSKYLERRFFTDVPALIRGFEVGEAYDFHGEIAMKRGNTFLWVHQASYAFSSLRVGKDDPPGDGTEKDFTS